jgi:predicted RNase H-like HicB family nuclease
MMNYTVILHPPDEAGWVVAECPALPGCVSQGENEEAALANIREAIAGCLLVLNERSHKAARKAKLEAAEVML